MAYQLEGRILEVCDCNVLCPCWIGEDPDNGTCDAVVTPTGGASRAILRGVLLVADAAHVRRRVGESGLDAGVGGR